MITGASRGIGRALAVALAGAGCHLLLTARDEDRLAALTAELTARPDAPSVAAMPADLLDEDARRAFSEWALSGERPPDILVNNAGAGCFGGFASSFSGDIERILRLNALVPSLLARAFMPVLASRPEAKIVNVSSGAAHIPYPGLGVYAAAKAYLSSLSETLICELQGTAVSVLCFHPGFTESDFASAAGMTPARRPKVLVRTPDAVAARLVRAIEKDETWTCSDLGTRLAITVGAALPHSLRWRLSRIILR
ncbi:MAG TPA: SDR family NAD(P)-dependent oxidoreductase [Candidatus Krumholzibacteria bacterium]|nr:SDR family NAD(P)-dependent oxidoreductase [Candidatus Krumholzibacteria bacterium]HPD73068.1 SDR family NAD(P)-dependent oxidoreductase [Candidatus Krumholzibacteria bacterium]HRY41868.1 SDR family NAD(P)-dependent oxidoreductase [Candidatus Krumholzibacteria bacterium]